MSPSTTEDKTTTSGTLLASADLRAGATLHATALPVGARPRTVGQRVEADVTAGEDMVPEPALQDEAAESGQVVGVRHLPLTATGRRARAGA